MSKSVAFSKRRGIWSILNAIGLLLLIIAVVLLVITLIKSYSNGPSAAAGKGYYTAVIVEIVPHIPSENAASKSLNNANLYVNIIENCSLHSPDIIIFPECGLVGCPNITDRDIIIEDFATVIPSPESGITPCHDNNYTELLSTMSCAAENYNVYVIVNLYEKVICAQNASDACPENEILLFNTNVAFDRSGKIIARYRKFNLYNERTLYGINSTREPEFSTFVSDFNVTFGMIICFDILFKQPSTDLITKMNVTDMIFSGAVYSEFPFLALTSLGAGWSYAMETTLLLSDMPTTFGGIGGSGIFMGRRDPLTVLMQEHNDTRYLVSKVPIKSHNSDHVSFNYPLSGEKLIVNASESREADLNNSNPVENLAIIEFNHTKFLIDSSLNSSIIRSLNENSSNTNVLQSSSFSYAEENFTCKIDVIWHSNTSTDFNGYRLVAFSGNRNFSNSSVNNYIEMCGLMLCKESENSTCILPPDLAMKHSLYIISINILVVSNVTTSIVIPSTLDKYLYPLSTSQFTFESFTENIGNQIFRITGMNLVRPVSNLVSFGTYSLPEQSTPNPQWMHYYKTKTTII